MRNSRPKNETEESKMQKMKTGLMMFCLTVLLSCAALMMNTPTASAMTLADLQGDYRVVRTAKWLRDQGANNTGLIISWVYEDGEYLGRIKKIPQGVDSNFLNPGDSVISNVYIENGTPHCILRYSYGNRRNNCYIKVLDNGGTLQVVDYEPIYSSEPVAWELHRI